MTSMTKVIKEKQGPTPLPLPDRREKFEPFEKWLTEYGATYADLVGTDSIRTCISTLYMCIIGKMRKKCYAAL